MSKKLLPDNRHKNTKINNVKRKPLVYGLKCLADVVEEAHRRVEDYSRDEIYSMCKDVIGYSRNDTVVVYQQYFDERGISYDKLQELRRLHPKLDSALKLCDSILASRYQSIPFHKYNLQKHCAFLLTKTIGGRFSDRAEILHTIDDRSIFSQLEASPIIEVVDCTRVVEKALQVSSKDITCTNESNIVKIN